MPPVSSEALQRAPKAAALAPGGRLAEVCTVLLRLGSGPLTVGTEVLTSSQSQFWEWALGEQEAAKMDPHQSSPRQVWGEADTGDELELIRPSIYRNVARQLNISLHSESVVTDAFLAVAAQIFAAVTTDLLPGHRVDGLIRVALVSLPLLSGRRRCVQAALGGLGRPFLPWNTLLPHREGAQGDRQVGRHHVGQGGVPVLGGCGAGCGLCAAGPARRGSCSRRLPRGVCAQDPGNLAAEARWMALKTRCLAPALQKAAWGGTSGLRGKGPALPCPALPTGLQCLTDVLKCVVSSNPGFQSHWFVTALCSFGRFLKAAFFVLLPER
ncbi:bcl-2-related ovarian killer protein [Myotis lucifugus]|uniref:bcl-2-related ovarian killer protein n=1 Tax=Myotis lucifugus TaxID=59463 RepID=UPI000CCC08BE|nr:bcl-2-related ovarian killer protein [Myotis lucifugus]